MDGWMDGKRKAQMTCPGFTPCPYSHALQTPYFPHSSQIFCDRQMSSCVRCPEVDFQGGVSLFSERNNDLQIESGAES